MEAEDDDVIAVEEVTIGHARVAVEVGKGGFATTSTGTGELDENAERAKWVLLGSFLCLILVLGADAGSWGCICAQEKCSSEEK